MFARLHQRRNPTSPTTEHDHAGVGAAEPRDSVLSPDTRYGSILLESWAASTGRIVADNPSTVMLIFHECLYTRHVTESCLVWKLHNYAATSTPLTDPWKMFGM